ncbi:CitB Response regulator containing a CheY-like receiver domain and an HTH DNA-binding domain [Candidatus Nanopelagicaceae bacterium]
MTYRVLVINDDAFELATLSAALRLHTINVIGEAKNLAVAENLFRSLQPEVLVIDIQFDGQEAISFLKKLRKLNPSLGIVLTTACPDLRLLGIAVKDVPTGTQLILKKSISSLEVIAETIRTSVEIAESKKPMLWVDSHGSLHENAFASVLSAMTDTQIETLRLVATGLSNAEIGRVRFVSEKSVEQIVARIAGHFTIAPDRTRNLRVLIAGQYYKWIGAPRH